MTSAQSHFITADGLTVTRTFLALPEAVFEAWTTPEHFAAWFGSDSVEVPLDTVSLDVRVGGAWSAVMHLPGGGTIDWVGEYLEVDPPRRLVLTMNDDPSAPAGEPLVVTFSEVEGGTEMTLVQARQGFSDEQLEATANGYAGFFDVMARLLAA